MLPEELKKIVEAEANRAAQRRYPSYDEEGDFEFNMQESCQQEVSDVFTEGCEFMYQHLSGWVEVSSGVLPENGKEVLVWLENFTNIPIQAYHRESDSTWRGSSEVRDCMQDGYAQSSELQFAPSHWMRLPKPPQP
jgi:hypothetical protein